MKIDIVAIARPCYLLAAVGALVAGVAGLVLPLLPTTPFLLVAAWAGGRGSPAFHHWLCHHPRLGPPISAWRQERAVPRGAKQGATALLALSWCGLAGLGVAPLALGCTALGFTAIALLLWRRPCPSGEAAILHGGGAPE